MRLMDVASRNFEGLDRSLIEHSRSSAGTLDTATIPSTEEIVRQIATSPGKTSLVVPGDLPALDVAHAIDNSNVEIVFLTDSSGAIGGIIEPKTVSKHVSNYLNVGETTFSDALKRLNAKPGEKERRYSHEWLSNSRVKMFWCPAGGHWTSKPCQLHAAA